MNTAHAAHSTKMFFDEVEDRSVQKHSNYFGVYDQYLERFRGKRPTVVEIGVQHGGSLLIWKSFFDDEVDIVGCDILEDCKKFESDNVRIMIGDQSDEDYLREIAEAVGKADIIIDDGSHIPSHQISTFNILFYELLNDGGVYICEDCHTSYWPSYGGGVRKRGTFIEFAKRLCDQVNAWAVDSSKLEVDRATRSIRSISFYPSIVVFEKGLVERPQRVEAGEVKIDLERGFKAGPMNTIVLRLKQSAFIQRLVRTNPYLWKLMRRVLNSGRNSSN